MRRVLAYFGLVGDPGRRLPTVVYRPTFEGLWLAAGIGVLTLALLSDRYLHDVAVGSAATLRFVAEGAIAGIVIQVLLMAVPARRGPFIITLDNPARVTRRFARYWMWGWPALGALVGVEPSWVVPALIGALATTNVARTLEHRRLERLAGRTLYEGADADGRAGMFINP